MVAADAVVIAAVKDLLLFVVILLVKGWSASYFKRLQGAKGPLRPTGLALAGMAPDWSEAGLGGLSYNWH